MHKVILPPEKKIMDLVYVGHGRVTLSRNVLEVLDRNESPHGISLQSQRKTEPSQARTSVAEATEGLGNKGTVKK